MAATSASAKPLYITVPRAYTTAEPVMVDVAFAGTAPVELRVLKPTDLDRYVREQANIRRAYTQPTTIVNPGRYLSRGLNAIDSPADYLLNRMSPEFRLTLSGHLPARLAVSEPLSYLRGGPKKLVGIPDGMEMVRTEWLNLDLGGSDRGFDVPGFEAWQGDSGFQERRVALKPLPAGVYVLQLVQDRVEGQVTLVVSDLTVQLKQTDGEILVRVAGKDQKPRQGAEVKVHVGDKPIMGKSDAQGEVRLDVNEPRVLVTIGHGADTALVDTDFYSTLAIAPDVFIYSDRPIYKPGDAVRFRGVVRKPASFLAQLFAPRKQRVTVHLKNHEGVDVSTGCRIDEYGSFKGTLDVPESLETGVVQLIADMDDNEYQSEARVQAYVKPTFYLELDTEQDSIKPGDTIVAKVKARRYAGGVPDNTRYEVFLYRTIATTPAWVDDAGMGGEGSIVTYGSTSTTEGQLTVPIRLYSSSEQRSESDPSFEHYDPWSSAPMFDAKGEAAISVRVPELSEEDASARTPFKYTLTVRAQDPEGSTASTSQPFFHSECAVLGQLSSNKPFVLKNGDATFSVRAVTLAGRPFGETGGEVDFVLLDADGDESSKGIQKITTNADGVWRVSWPTDGIGAVLARVTLRDRENQAWHGETRLLVIGTEGEAVVRVPILTTEALPKPLEPGEQAQLVALLPDGWGPGGNNGGPVWITLSGNALYETELVQVRGTTLVYDFAIEKRFGSAVYASVAYPTATGRWDERVVAFRVIPKQRTLQVNVEPKNEEALPNGKQSIRVKVTDHTGKGVAAQVSVGVVDKAVYAIQQEFRPNILSFFYPLVRNNIANFYSAEFQGYGYGEYLARLRGRIRDHEFAAVKPPQIERKDEDTAYWNPSVVTDASGAATVNFKLPGNQTLWVITAVAADASGRFGEGTAEFASRGKLFVAASLPQFLRQGDEVTGTIRVANNKGKRPRTVSLGLDGQNGVSGSGTFAGLAIAAKSERVLSVQFKAEAVGNAKVALRVESDDGVRTDLRSLPVRPAAIEQLIVSERQGGGSVELEVPEKATLTNVELNLMPTTVAAALASVRGLLNYPYGCLEQLIATTVPNIAVYRTLKEVGSFGKLDPESQALLEEAYSRSIFGLTRIKNLAVKSGGYTWFSGYSEPTVPLTLIAVDGLTYAVEAGLVAKNDEGLQAAAEYLARQEGLPATLDVTRTYVLARLQGSKHAARARTAIASASGKDMYAAALTVLAAEHAGIIQEPQVAAKVQELAAVSASNITKVADYRFGDAFWRYPLGRVGLTAIVTHAASYGTIDKDAARSRFVAAMGGAAELSTFDRSTALLHSLWLLKDDAKSMQQMPAPKVTAHGVGEVALRPRGTGMVANLPASVLRVDLGTFEGAAILSATALVPLEQVKAEEKGMSVKRSYWLLRPDGREPIEDGATVAQGQYVFVEIEFDAHDGEKYRTLRSAYYVLEDGVPAGFEPVIEDKKFRSPPYDLPLRHEALKYRSLNPERAVFFFDEPAWWSRSPRSVGYVMRAQYAGDFSTPPAKLTDMYSPEIYAQTAATRLKIAASK